MLAHLQSPNWGKEETKKHPYSVTSEELLLGAATSIATVSAPLAALLPSALSLADSGSGVIGSRKSTADSLVSTLHALVVESTKILDTVDRRQRLHISFHE